LAERALLEDDLFGLPVRAVGCGVRAWFAAASPDFSSWPQAAEISSVPATSTIHLMAHDPSPFTGPAAWYLVGASPAHSRHPATEDVAERGRINLTEGGYLRLEEK
jgi:hypothetical protein